MDPLSDVLSLLKPRSCSCAGFDIGGDQCIRMPEHHGIICYAILSGEMWLSVDGGSNALLLKSGDCVVLPTGKPFVAGTDLSPPPLEPGVLVQNCKTIGGITYYNGGGKCFVIACHFEIGGKHAEVLLSLLSPVVHLRTDKDRAFLLSTLERMRHELYEPQPGAALVVEHLAHLILVQALRLHLAEDGVGWLYALGDKKLSAAIKAMHADPAHRWTLDSLASTAAMSRTSFAVRFKEAVGATPFDYLRRWRMLLAANRLLTGREPISTIALSLGYESESAFSTSFKTVMGVSPRQYGRREMEDHSVA